MREQTDKVGLAEGEADEAGHDQRSNAEDDEALYDRFSPLRKKLIVLTVSVGGLTAAMTSMLLLSAIPELAVHFQTTVAIINLSNALYMVFMGISPIFWGPASQFFGRRWSSIASSLLFTAFSIGTALAPNLPAFFIFRMLSAFEGTAFFIIGSSCIGDIYKPTQRASALGWFLSGTLVGPAFGPFLGGVIITFQTWRSIFWVQTGLGGLSFLLVLAFLPETARTTRHGELRGLSLPARAAKLSQAMNPLRVIRLFKFPNLLIVGLASASLIWNMQCLLTPVRYVMNPRFGLTSPLQSGLFFLAPGTGYLVGTLFGGHWADRTVRRWTRKRGGKRIPEDRLRSSLVSMGVVVPCCILIYGWAVEKKKGGIPVPVICMFLQGVAHMVCFPSLNTYCLDVFRDKSSETIAGNYFIRYLIAALGTAFCVPGIDSIGLGWFSTISSVFVFSTTVATYLVVLHGPGWREKIYKLADME